MYESLTTILVSFDFSALEFDSHVSNFESDFRVVAKLVSLAKILIGNFRKSIQYFNKLYSWIRLDFEGL